MWPVFIGGLVGSIIGMFFFRGKNMFDMYTGSVIASVIYMIAFIFLEGNF